MFGEALPPRLQAGLRYIFFVVKAITACAVAISANPHVAAATYAQQHGGGGEGSSTGGGGGGGAGGVTDNGFGTSELGGELVGLTGQTMATGKAASKSAVAPLPSSSASLSGGSGVGGVGGDGSGGGGIGGGIGETKSGASVGGSSKSDFASSLAASQTVAPAGGHQRLEQLKSAAKSMPLVMQLHTTTEEERNSDYQRIVCNSAVLWCALILIGAWHLPALRMRVGGGLLGWKDRPQARRSHSNKGRAHLRVRARVLVHVRWRRRPPTSHSACTSRCAANARLLLFARSRGTTTTTDGALVGMQLVAERDTTRVNIYSIMLLLLVTRLSSLLFVEKIIFAVVHFVVIFAVQLAFGVYAVVGSSSGSSSSSGGSRCSSSSSR